MIGPASPEPWLVEAVKGAMPTLIPLMTAAVGYYLGRRAKHDDIEIKKRHELAADVSITFQELVALYDRLNRSYDINFRNRTPDETADSIEGYALLHSEDTKLIEELSANRDRLERLIRSGRLYLNAEMLNKMEEYVRTGDFSYTTDGGIFVNTYLRDFLQNLRDTRLDARRREIARDVLQRMKKLTR